MRQAWSTTMVLALLALLTFSAGCTVNLSELSTKMADRLNVLAERAGIPVDPNSISVVGDVFHVLPTAVQHGGVPVRKLAEGVDIGYVFAPDGRNPNRQPKKRSDTLYTLRLFVDGQVKRGENPGRVQLVGPSGNVVNEGEGMFTWLSDAPPDEPLADVTCGTGCYDSSDTDCRVRCITVCLGGDDIVSYHSACFAFKLVPPELPL